MNVINRIATQLHFHTTELLSSSVARRTDVGTHSTLSIAKPQTRPFKARSTLSLNTQKRRYHSHSETIEKKKGSSIAVVSFLSLLGWFGIIHGCSYFRGGSAFYTRGIGTAASKRLKGVLCTTTTEIRHRLLLDC